MLSSSAHDNITPEHLQACQEILEYQFKDIPLLLRCLTHASAARTRLESNERMEFLGDAILGAAVCQSLIERFPESSEGELTRIKSVVVSRATCARLIRKMHLEKFLILGKGITMTEKIPGSVLATAFEAIIGGIYVDGGYHAAQDFVVRVTETEITRAAESAVGVNYKSLFQQRAQKHLGETPYYQVLDEHGPDHSKFFLVVAFIGEEEFPPAWGPSKKIAEQRAAQNAICALDGNPPAHDPEFPGG